MNKRVLLAGTGRMGIEYARVLSAMNISFIPVGRGEESARLFNEQTGIQAVTGGMERFLERVPDKPATAIIAVNVPDLYSLCRSLLLDGVQKILVEKPGALTIKEIGELQRLSEERKAELFIAYNRRFLETVREAKRLITADGGVLSFSFEFTEWSDMLSSLMLMSLRSRGGF